MAERRHKTVLFLCTGNYYRSRFAEILFNAVAERMRLPWKASSRGLALERGAGNIGPISQYVLQALEPLGVRAAEAVARFPAQVTLSDLEGAQHIVALKHAEHLPLIQERYAAWAEKVEFWHVDDAPGALSQIEREIMDLAARLIGGGQRREPSPLAPAPEAPAAAAPRETAAARPVVRVSRETKGRRGKGVTIVSDVPLDAAGLEALAATLKQRCGTGGTVKEGRIEIQGDQRDRLVAVLEALGYRVKRVGG